MANEIVIAPGDTGLDVYALVRNSAWEVWKGDGWATYNSVNRDDYANVTTEEGDTGVYLIDFPAAITTPGIYTVEAFIKAGGSYLDSDERVGYEDIHWDGTAVTGMRVGDGAVTEAAFTLPDENAIVAMPTGILGVILRTFRNLWGPHNRRDRAAGVVTIKNDDDTVILQEFTHTSSSGIDSIERTI